MGFDWEFVLGDNSYEDLVDDAFRWLEQCDGSYYDDVYVYTAQEEDTDTNEENGLDDRTSQLFLEKPVQPTKYEYNSHTINEEIAMDSDDMPLPY